MKQKQHESNLNRLIGKKVISIRGIRTKIDNRIKNEYIEPRLILFDDGRTFIELEGQDYYSFHDCSASALLIFLREDRQQWRTIINNFENYPLANQDI